MQLSLTLTSQFDTSLMMSADEFRYNFLSGIPIKGFDGYTINNQQIEKYIRAQTIYCEDLLRIKIIPRLLNEQQDYERLSFYRWGFLKTNYNIQTLISLTGKLGSLTTTIFATDVIYTKKQMPDELNHYLNVIPSATYFIVFTTAFYILLNWNDIPNYFNVIYLTGYDKVTDDLYDFIGKKALYDILTTLGHILFPIGIASQSKSIDSVSQSISSTRTASTNLFSATQNQLKEDFKSLELILKDKYQPIICFRL